MSYADLEQFKTYLKFSDPSQPHAEDTLLQQFLDEASAILDDVIGRPSAVASTTVRRFDALKDVDGRTLTFDCDVAAAITQVVNGDGVIIPPSAYVTEPRNVGPFYGLTLKVGADYIWTFDDSPEGAIEVTGYWCWSENADGSADALIVGATLQLAAWLYRTKDQVADLSRPVATGDGVTILPMALPRAVLDRVMARRRLV